MPKNTQMHMQWITVNGQSVPLVLPQFWDGEKWVISSEQNPLPVKAELTGSNMEDVNAIPTRAITRQELEVLVDSEVLEAGADTGVRFLNPKGAKEIYLFIQIDKQPWSIRYRNQFGNVSARNGFPVLDMVETTHGRAVPAISFPIGYNPAQGVPAPSNMKEAKDWGLPITASEYFMIHNHSDEDATVTVSILRVWR